MVIGMLLTEVYFKTTHQHLVLHLLIFLFNVAVLLSGLCFHIINVFLQPRSGQSWETNCSNQQAFPVSEGFVFVVLLFYIQNGLVDQRRPVTFLTPIFLSMESAVEQFKH